MNSLKIRVFTLLILISNLTLAGGFKLPEYKKVTLNNSLTIYLMEQHEVPLIYMSALVPAGAALDGNKNGLAFLTSESLLFGTKNYSKKQIEETFEFYGAKISTTPAAEFIRLTASYSKQNQEKLLPIFHEILTAPSFPNDEIDKRKQRLMVELDQAKESPRQVIRSYFNKFIFGDNELGNPIDGIKSKISEITAENLKNFYSTNFDPKNSAIAIVGDFNTTEMLNEISKLFSSWTSKNIQSVKTLNQPELKFEKSRVLLVNKNDANETTFLIGGKGISRSNPEFTEIDVINTILGGRFTSWLNEELRINSGLTYGARSTFYPYKNTGTFYVSTFTATKNTEQAIDLAIKVLDRLQTTGISDEVLSSAKSYIKGQFPPDFETSGSLANLLTSMFYYGFDDSYINDFEKNVDGLTVSKANEIARKYFPSDNLQFIIVGRASEIKNIVKKYGEVTEKEITADGF